MPDDHTKRVNLNALRPPLSTGAPAVSTEIERLRARLATFERFNTVGELARGIVHEINQPLAAIANFASAMRSEILSQQGRSYDDFVATLSQIEEQAIRAASIVRNLRRLSRRAESYHQKCKIRDLISEVIPLIQSQAAGYGVDLDIQLADQLPSVSVDYHQIQHALMCMVSHAIAVIEERQPFQRHLRIAAYINSLQDIEIVVSYSCIDCSEEELPQLFQPFKLNDLNYSHFHLAVCRRIADLHHAYLTAEHCDGEATLLRLCMPIRPT